MELKKSDWYETKSKIHIEMTYGQLKQQMRSLFRNLGDFVYYSFTLENDGKTKLIDFLKKIGINSQLQKDGKIIKIDLNKHHNFFEEQFATLMNFNKCSICNKYIYSPVRTLFRDCPYHNPNEYGETFIHQGKPICDNCFAPIVKQWKNQLNGIRERWVKREHPEWKKIDGKYVDLNGIKYPL